MNSDIYQIINPSSMLISCGIVDSFLSVFESVSSLGKMETAVPIGSNVVNWGMYVGILSSNLLPLSPPIFFLYMSVNLSCPLDSFPCVFCYSSFYVFPIFSPGILFGYFNCAWYLFSKHFLKKTWALVSIKWMWLSTWTMPHVSYDGRTYFGCHAFPNITGFVSQLVS